MTTGTDEGDVMTERVQDDEGAVTTDGGTNGLDDIRRLRATARRDRQAWPFALVVLGLVVILAAPFYVARTPGAGPTVVVLTSDTLGPLAEIGPPFAALGLWAGVYWIVALVAAGLLIAVHYRRTAARRGIAGPLWPVAATGIVLLVLLVALTPRILNLLSPSPTSSLSTGAGLPAAETLWLRGLTPLLVVALIVVVLAWTERSIWLAAVAAGYLALALVANLYDLSNLGYRAGWPPAGRFDLLPNLLLPGLVLLVAGAAAAALRRVAR